MTESVDDPEWRGALAAADSIGLTPPVLGPNMPVYVADDAEPWLVDYFDPEPPACIWLMRPGERTAGSGATAAEDDDRATLLRELDRLRGFRVAVATELGWSDGESDETLLGKLRDAGEQISGLGEQLNAAVELAGTRERERDELAHANVMRIGEWETERRQIARLLGADEDATWLQIKKWADHVTSVIVGDLLRERDEAKQAIRGYQVMLDEIRGATGTGPAAPDEPPTDLRPLKTVVAELKQQRDDARAAVHAAGSARDWARLVVGLRDRGELDHMAGVAEVVTVTLDAIDQAKSKQLTAARERDDAVTELESWQGSYWRLHGEVGRIADEMDAKTDPWPVGFVSHAQVDREVRALSARLRALTAADDPSPAP